MNKIVTLEKKSLTAENKIKQLLQFLNMASKRCNKLTNPVCRMFLLEWKLQRDSNDKINPKILWTLTYSECCDWTSWMI